MLFCHRTVPEAFIKNISQKYFQILTLKHLFLLLPNSARLGKDILSADLLRLTLGGGWGGGGGVWGLKLPNFKPKQNTNPGKIL